MELVKIWIRLSLFVGLLICWTKALPLDMETAQVAVMTGINVALDAADKLKGEVGTSNEVAVAGVGFKHSHHASFGDVNGSEERRRRRRSANESEASGLPHEHRDKRSPCRAAPRSTTTAAPATTPDVEENVEVAKIKADEKATKGRRRRSPNQNDMDADDQSTLGMMSGVIEKLQKSIHPPPEQSN